MNLAFKNADLAAAADLAVGRLAGAFVSKAIKWKTGGRFSHVELWVSGSKEAAICFSSREPSGTGYATIDLSEQIIGQDMWTCIEIPATAEQMTAIRWFAEGTGLKRYDFLGILGFVLPQRTHDPACVFCSEWCCSALQRCCGIFSGVSAWTIDPTALYEMAVKL